MVTLFNLVLCIRIILPFESTFPAILAKQNTGYPMSTAPSPASETNGQSPHCGSVVPLPTGCTYEGQNQVHVEASFSLLRFDDAMFYVVFTEPKLAARVMSTPPHQVFVAPAVLSRLSTM